MGWVLRGGFAALTLWAEELTCLHSGIAVVGTAFLTGLLAIRASRDWREGTGSFFVVLFLEDLLRKFSGNPLVVFFFKDAIFLGTLTGLIREEGIRRVWQDARRLPLSLVFLFLWALTRVPPALGVDARVPVVGFRMWFGGVPLFLVGLACARTPAFLRGVLNGVLWGGGGIAILGILQQLLGWSFLNPDIGWNLDMGRHRWYGPGGIAHPTNSIFMSPSRYALILFSLSTLGWFWCADEPRGRRRCIPWAAMLCGLLLSGQKAAVAAAGMVGAVRLVRERGRERVRLLVVLLLLAVLLGGGMLMSDGVFSILRYYGFHWSGDYPEFDVRNRIREMRDWGAIASERAGFLGLGTGTASKGVNYLSEVSRRPLLIPGYTGYHSLEGGLTSVWWEWGVVGLVLWGAFAVEMIDRSWRAGRGGGTPILPGWNRGHFLFTMLLLGPLFLNGVQAYQDHVVQSIFWWGTGVTWGLAREQTSGEVE